MLGGESRAGAGGGGWSSPLSTPARLRAGDTSARSRAAERCGHATALPGGFAAIGACHSRPPAAIPRPPRRSESGQFAGLVGQTSPPGRGVVGLRFPEPPALTDEDVMDKLDDMASVYEFDPITGNIPATKVEITVSCSPSARPLCPRRRLIVTSGIRTRNLRVVRERRSAPQKTRRRVRARLSR
ncbi:copine-5-like isoform X1 [Arapaima gigas]